ncbi:MAG: class I SAM-dependent methyltransferase, partial [Actinomycetaceae bacterium]
MHPADFYTGIVPEIYNVLRGTHFDVERYRAFIEEHGTPALELGCGDSGPFYRLAALGLDLEGVDSSEDMVRRGRERLAADGLDTPIHHQRMEDLALGRTFPSVYLAGPTFNLLPDDATALAALRAIARHLSPDGAALVPLWVPGPTPAEQIGVPREARAGDSDARYTVTGEDY